MVTLSLLKALCPQTKESTLLKYVDSLNEVAEYYELTKSPVRLAAFLAQVAHESGGFNAIKENLNYSASGLRNTFGKYFTTDDMANQYARKPEKIANKVYANRMGNGSEESEDGYRYCGRGLIQVTGRDNYTWFADSLEITPEQASEYMETFEGAAQSACWFWETNNLNQWADKGDIVTLTKRINGGTIGLEDRKKHYEHALQVLGE